MDETQAVNQWAFRDEFGDMEALTKPKALDTQIGGDHYKSMRIQPLEFIMANKLAYCEANVVKYISRWRNKNGVEDLRKAKHYIDLLIQEATQDEAGNV